MSMTIYNSILILISKWKSTIKKPETLIQSIAFLSVLHIYDYKTHQVDNVICYDSACQAIFHIANCFFHMIDLNSNIQYTYMIIWKCHETWYITVWIFLAKSYEKSIIHTWVIMVSNSINCVNITSQIMRSVILSAIYQRKYCTWRALLYTIQRCLKLVYYIHSIN